VPKITSEPLIRVQLRIYKKDKARLEALFANNIGVNEGVRKILRHWLNQSEDEMRAHMDELKADDL
jgi:hypothetical protein